MKWSFPHIASLVFILALLLGYAISPAFRLWLSQAYTAFATGDIETIRQFLQRYQQYGYLIILSAFIFQMVLFVLPSVSVMILSVLMYGPFEGTLLSIAGIALASTIAYFLGQSLSSITLAKIMGQNSQQKLSAFLRNYGFATVFIFRLSPFFSNDAVSFAGGLVSMNYGRFMAATLLGITPLALLIAYFGGSSSNLETGLIIASIIGLASLAVYIYLDQRKPQS